MENLKQDLSNKFIYNSNPFLIYLMNYRFKKQVIPKQERNTNLNLQSSKGKAKKKKQKLFFQDKWALTKIYKY